MSAPFNLMSRIELVTKATAVYERTGLDPLQLETENRRLNDLLRAQAIAIKTVCAAVEVANNALDGMNANMARLLDEVGVGDVVISSREPRS